MNNCIKCKFCSEEFNSLNNLIEHSKTHSEEIKERCILCNKIYATRACLLRHVKKSHNESLEDIYKKPPHINSFSTKKKLVNLDILETNSPDFEENPPSINRSYVPNDYIIKRKKLEEDWVLRDK